MSERVHVFHEFPPLYREDSEVLILGSIPSPKSREQAFYYGHPQNRFWKVMAAVLNETLPQNIEEKRDMMLRNRIALWDVLAECEIAGASDTSIRNPKANPIEELLQQTRIHSVFVTGSTAAKLYEKLVQPNTGIPAHRLPSTSPANCACSMECLYHAYRIVAQALQKDHIE